ncbi:unnamed protein product [Acanthosepion pharaonis]|uniref:Uncharacterized protein n=1 Tax=Acanthosepion pharaonis TaxID=158019 RepID=A0A812C4G4_ACAPH|nr:unnamed protein product [Sepia pharaonis]
MNSEPPQQRNPEEPMDIGREVNITTPDGMENETKGPHGLRICHLFPLLSLSLPLSLSLSPSLSFPALALSPIELLLPGTPGWRNSKAASFTDVLLFPLNNVQPSYVQPFRLRISSTSHWEVEIKFSLNLMHGFQSNMHVWYNLQLSENLFSISTCTQFYILSIYLSIYLSINLSIYLSISIYFFSKFLWKGVVNIMP